ncbi:NnrU family protein [Pseudorhizobium endolithicum]|uniref:NnrU family protein n=1 Tax=Pseudorhizobium endolithicum TaxID=1191678 RepID=A0ABN7JFC7_9HYPH|nr:NnrU family protein [Pseudorhizobium endolithicum]CAD6409833.1 NnrU family protein [Rhizobium sp. Q54]CAD7024687.1 NnrU family protein [Pseudorhizobium endolithicum]
MLLLVISLILFFGIHLVRVVAPGWRASVIAARGERAWKLGYSVASIATLVLVIYAFGQARQETGILYTPPVWMAHLSSLLMLVAMICLVASLMPPGHISTKTKHPMVLSVKIWALAHLLANGETSSVILFAGFLAWGVVLRIALKRRERSGDLVRKPFLSARYDAAAVVVGTIVYLLFIWRLHLWLIGVQPLPI